MDYTNQQDLGLLMLVKIGRQELLPNFRGIASSIDYKYSKDKVENRNDRA